MRAIVVDYLLCFRLDVVCYLVCCVGFAVLLCFWVFVFDMLCAVVFAANLRCVNSVVALVGNDVLHVACGSLITLAIGLRFIMV